MWLNKDGSVGAVISDVFNSPIHIHATKEGSEYRVRGWRGIGPEFRRLPIEIVPREDGLPDSAPYDPCRMCEGRLFWRASVVARNPNQTGNQPWRCATCEPADEKLWIDGVALPERAKAPVKVEVAPKPVTGSLL